MGDFINTLKEDLLHCETKIESQTKSVETILSSMKESINQIDFREKIKDNEKIKIKDYVVLVINNLTHMILSNNWDFIIEHDMVMLYDGTKWIGVPNDELKRFLRDVAINMGAPELQMRHFSNLEALLRQFLVDARLHHSDNSQHKVLINLVNGTLSVNRDGYTLYPFRKEDYLKYQLPFEYNKDAECPIFNNFLEKNLPDKGCQKVLAEYIASIFCPWLHMEKCLLLYGGGANGKSVFASVIYALLGSENVTSFSLPALTSRDGYARAEIENKLLNICSELDSKHYETSIMKALISQEPIDARRPYGKAFNMENYAKLMFCCNVLPENCELTNAFFRRFLIVPWEICIPEKEQDVELANKIIAKELPGVLNWVLSGLVRLLEQRKYTDAQKINEAVAAYKEESDTVIMYLSENNITPGDETHILVSQLNVEYNDYCRSRRLPAVSLKVFSDYLGNKGFQRKRLNKGRYVWISRHSYNEDI